MLCPLNYFVTLCLMLKFPFKLTLTALSAFCILNLLISLVAADFLWAEINQLLMMSLIIDIGDVHSQIHV